MLLNVSKYRSVFGGLWTDMANAHDEVTERLATKLISKEEAELLDFWIDKGYVIIQNAVPDDVIDNINNDIEQAWETLNDKVKVFADFYEQTSLDVSKRSQTGYKILDLYPLYPNFLSAMFADKIQRFLKIIFEQDILAFQTISFERGSEQAMHQDPAYVVLSSPMQLAASWIALEDIEPGSGELIYYEGSHKIKEFLFRDIYKHWDGTSRETLEKYLKSLHIKCQEINLPLKKFNPKKGDALIWAADLVHGGSQITHPNPSITRRSLVTHYCPYDVSPNYFRFMPEHQVKAKYKEGCYYASCYHKLSKEMNSTNEDAVLITQLRNEVEVLQNTIKSMQSNKFWKMRTLFFIFKRAFGLK